MRRLLDFYPTPAKLTEKLLDIVPVSGIVLEPCAGDGAIVNLLKEKKIQTVTNDIGTYLNWDYNADATNHDSWNNWDYVDWVVTNPPFNAAPQIIPLAYEAASVGVAMLLRLSYLEPAGNRGEWLTEHSENLSDIIIFGQPRPSFTGNGTDSCTTAWFVWRKSRITAGTQLHFLPGWK